MSKINIAICGLGVMGQRHLRLCKELEYNICYQYDPKNNDNYDNFLKQMKDVVGVIISSSTIKHIDNIIDILNINPEIKILCEKPISYNSSDPRINIIKKFSSSILVGQIERFNNAFIVLKNILRNKSILQIKTIRVNNTPSREDIHCKLDIGIHDLDLCCNLCDSYPLKIDILSNKLYTHENLIYTINGIQIINEVSWNYPYKKRILQVLTEDGVYDCDLFQQKLIFTDWSNQQTIIPIQKIEPLKLEHMEFISMCLGIKDSISTIENNLQLLKLMGY